MEPFIEQEETGLRNTSIARVPAHLRDKVLCIRLMNLLGPIDRVEHTIKQVRLLKKDDEVLEVEQMLDFMLSDTQSSVITTANHQRAAHHSIDKPQFKMFHQFV